MMALLFPQSRKLQSDLFEYFIVITKLCHMVLKFTQKSTLGKLVASLNDSDLNYFQLQLDIWANSIKEEVSFLTTKNIRKENEDRPHSRALLKSTGFTTLRQRFRDKQRVLDSCSKYDYETTWKQTRKRGSTTIFRQIPQYDLWKSNPNSSTLLYTGILGSGKSVLMANIVDDLHLTEGEEIMIAYFFCRYDLPESLKARTILGSLARQLLRSIPNLTCPDELILLDQNNGAFDTKEITDLLGHVLPPKNKTFFVLDGLDECDTAEKDTLIQNLCLLQERLALLLCVSLRQEPTTTVELGSIGLVNVVIASMPEENPDIEEYIQMELERRVESGKLGLGDASLILEIRQALLQGSQGMFLWVYLQIESLCEMRTDKHIRDALLSLPRDLSETFTRILASKSGVQYQRQILELISVAIRPLTTEELQEALSVIPGDTVWDATKLINDIHKTIACCGSIILVDEEEFTVRFVHSSVKQYLFDGFQPSDFLPFPTSGAERLMSAIIITYLNYDVFKGKISTEVVPQMKIGMAPSNIILSATNNQKKVQAIALNLLRSKKLPDPDIAKILAQTRSSSKPRFAREYRFYSYARTYWLEHLMRSPSVELAVRGLLKRLMETSVANMDIELQGGQTMLHWAAKNGCISVIHFIIEDSSFELDAIDDFGKTALHWAAANGHKAVFCILRDRIRYTMNQADNDGRSPLSWAAAHGHEDIVETILEQRYLIADLPDKNGRSPLSWAASNGKTEIIKMLLRTELGKVDFRDKKGKSPLLWAAANGHRDSVWVLLECNAISATLKDFDGKSALSWAAANGHEDVVELLLNCVHGRMCASIEDNEGRTPRFHAKVNGHKKIAMLLQEYTVSSSVLRSSRDRLPYERGQNSKTSQTTFVERPFSGVSLRPAL